MKKIVGFCVLVLFLVCCKTTVEQPSLKEDVAFLASDALKGRATGSTDEIEAATYLAKRLESMGYDSKGGAGTYFQTFTFKNKRDPHQEIQYVSAGDSTITGTNVMGFWDNKAEKTIVLGAHYDHLGMGGEGSLYRGEPEIHNGADDNASGVAAILKLAHHLKDSLTATNIMVQFYSGEELGLLGSNYFCKNPTIDLEKVSYMINLDMVGRLREDKTLSISGVGTSPIWKQTLNANNNGFKLVLNESGVGPSDHTSFYLQDIPALHFFTGQHEDYHRPTDDADKLNYDGMEQLVAYLTSVCMDLDKGSKLMFKTTKNESEEVPRFKVGLGVIPDYLFDGKGMRIDGISEDKPAQKAGLQKGDVVIQLGDSTVTDMMSYMRALSSFEKGDATKVVIDRNGEKIEVEIQF
ncbi:M20/M25/M40 family metallo-hydrolase [Muricauda sp. SCSIO 64092]|uniref:M20/M25/M40 family metallo-hydrolase n=1 Tax=Allomuricauda sp. SCSIO 64092 TaxID=2908842 RepID=UPI001FF62E0F|nr:M20/M25/M40 family metallo-hydrolase [Muricauda sp. SCSIO 64092]UOY08902.1 M20/M25/M40 family metallo-hydrolase [Muricauda sp. SCSIO 64092]